MTAKNLLVLAAAVVCCALSTAQPPANTLTREGDTFRHEPSKSSLKVSKDWEVVDTKGSTNQPVHLSLRKPFGGVDVLVTWVRLQDIKFDEAVEIEVNQLGQTYGKDKVAKKEPVTVDSKSVAVIEIADGPDRNGKQMGVVYLLDAGPDARERWKIKVRAVINKANQSEGLKLVSGLLQQFQW